MIITHFQLCTYAQKDFASTAKLKLTFMDLIIACTSIRYKELSITAKIQILPLALLIFAMSSHIMPFINK